MDIAKILVVDDDMMSRQMAEFILKQGGHEVHSVQSGAGAISALGLQSYDLVLLDFEMPEMNGVETLREIRRMDGEIKDISVVFLTADASAKTVSEAAALGVSGYIKKPFMPQDLLDRVDKVLLSKFS